ncbi:hypothetical protein SCOR_28905 [Sulfidibacter corallicola]
MTCFQLFLVSACFSLLSFFCVSAEAATRSFAEIHEDLLDRSREARNMSIAHRGHWRAFP